MPDELEEFIKKHREELDFRAPSDMHQQRFEARLKKQNPPKGKVIAMNGLWKYAAAVALLVTSLGWYFSEQETVDPTEVVAETEVPQEATLSGVSEKYAEVEGFMQQAIAVKLKTVESYGVQDESYVKDCLARLDHLDEQYQKLRKELAQNYGDERVVNSMIQNYRLKLQMLEQLLQRIEFIQQQKQSGNENIQA